MRHSAWQTITMQLIRTGLVRVVLVLLVVVAVAMLAAPNEFGGKSARGGLGQEKGKGGRDAKREEKSAHSGLEGTIIPVVSAVLYAPEGSFRLPGWNMDNGGLEPTFLACEGCMVKKGEKVAEFKADLGRLPNWIAQSRSIASAERSLQITKQEQEIATLKVGLDGAKIAKNRLSLELLKGDLLASVDTEIAKIDVELAAFDVVAIEQRIAVMEKHLITLRSYLDSTVSQWDFYQRRVDEFSEHLTMVAPHAGVVFFPRLPFFKRKAKMGQWLRSGWAFMRIASGSELEVEAYLPEAMRNRLAPGDFVTVELADGKQRVDAVVRSISDFPQYMGYFDDDFSTAAALRKVFVARIQTTAPLKAKAGTDAVVNLPNQRKQTS